VVDILRISVYLLCKFLRVLVWGGVVVSTCSTLSYFGVPHRCGGTFYTPKELVPFLLQCKYIGMPK
jgi:hypothetical protein